MKSVDAIKAATTNITVVKNPNVFCNLTNEEYMLESVCGCVVSVLVEEVFGQARAGPRTRKLALECKQLMRR